MNSIGAEPQLEMYWYYVIGIIVFSIIFSIIKPIWQKMLPKDSPYKGAKNLDDISSRTVFMLGSERQETPFLDYKTLHSTLGAKLGVTAIVGLMLFIALSDLSNSSNVGLSGPAGWAIIALATYQLIWIIRFYVKYDGKTLQTIDWLHRRKEFQQDELISIVPQSNSQTYRLLYHKGHVSILMFIQGRQEFLKDMNAKISENNARLM